MSVKGYLSTIEYADTADHATATTWTKLTKVRSIKPMTVKAKDIDVTTLESPDEFEEVIAGLAEAGEVEIDALYDADDADDVYGLFRQTKGFRIKYGAGTSGWKFNGYISEIGDGDVETGKVVSSSVKIKVTGKPVRVADFGA